MAAVAFVDIETLNLARPLLGGEPGVWEAAAIRCDIDPDRRTLNVVDNWWGFLQVDGLHMQHADPSSLRVNRFYERHPAYRPRRSQAVITLDDDAFAVYPDRAEPIQSLNDIPGDTVAWAPQRAAREIARVCAGATLIAANPSFDEERLALLLHEWGHCLTVDYHLGCVRQLAAGWLAGRASVAGHQPTAAALPPLSGSALMAAVAAAGGPQPDPDEAHTAWADTVLAMRTYAFLMQLEEVSPYPLAAPAPGQHLGYAMPWFASE